MIERRQFLQQLLASAGLFLVPKIASSVVHANTALANNDGETMITILHTNDTHSQIDPFPAGTRNAGLGGIARRATYFKKVRAENANTLIVDAGDMFDGSPYFNFFHGEVEIKAMSQAGYDVVTLGNHDFSEGIEGLMRVLKFAKFQIVSANYDFGTTPLHDIVKPYVIKTLAGIRIGIFGLGVDFAGLVTSHNHEGISYLDPIATAKSVATKLRQQEKVDLVIALSHLGWKFTNQPEQVTDQKVAAAVPEIDFIASGHTHSFMEKPDIIKHADGRETIIFQVGFGGINVGRVDFMFTGKKLTSFRSSVQTIDGEMVGGYWPR